MNAFVPVAQIAPTQMAPKAGKVDMADAGEDIQKVPPSADDQNHFDAHLAGTDQGHSAQTAAIDKVQQPEIEGVKAQTPNRMFADFPKVLDQLQSARMKIDQSTSKAGQTEASGATAKPGDAKADVDKQFDTALDRLKTLNQNSFQEGLMMNAQHSVTHVLQTLVKGG